MRTTLSFDDYQLAAARTAAYPEVGRNFVYPALGLTGESGEVCEKVADVLELGSTPERLAVLNKEFGDVLWYVAQTLSEIGYSFSDVMQDRFGAADFDSVQALLSPAANPSVTGLRLSAAAGQVAERVKKVIRDQGGILAEPVAGVIATHVTVVMQHVFELSASYELSLADVARANTEKLADRARRNVLKGDGDLR